MVMNQLMLEIKCPPKREIKNDYIPEYYWVQMQLSIRIYIAELEICDFLQMVLIDIDEHIYYNSCFDKSDIALNNEGLKGFIIVCYDNDNN